MHVFISESVGDVMLGIEGRLTVDEAVNLIKSLNNNKM